MMKKRIVKVPYGIASIYPNGVIEINKKLDKYPKLRKKIMQHELRHDIGSYSLKDWKNDFQAKNSHFLEAFKFSLKNPEALIGYMPFMFSYYSRKWTFNLSSIYPIIEFGFIFCLFWSIVCMLFDFNPFISFGIALIWWFNVVVIINIVLLIYTYFYVVKQEFIHN